MRLILRRYGMRVDAKLTVPRPAPVLLAMQHTDSPDTQGKETRWSRGILSVITHS